MPDQDFCHQQHSSPPKPVHTTRCNSLSPSRPHSQQVLGGTVSAFPRRSSSAKPGSPPALRSDAQLSPRPHTSPPQAQAASPPQQRCASPTISAQSCRRQALRNDNCHSLSNAESLKEVFDWDAGHRSPRTPTHCPAQLTRSVSMRPMLGQEAPSRPVCSSPYTSHIEGQLRHLEKHCHGLEAQV